MICLLGAGFLLGCAPDTTEPTTTLTLQQQQHEPETDGIPDPLKPMNQAFFDLNIGLDECLLEPITLGYEAITPPPLQEGIHNFLTNLSSPRIFLSCVLQGKDEEAAIALGRLLFNTIFGFFGLVDVASEIGLKPVEGDFGRTLQAWGMESGPYLVLPLIGPTTFRDGFGLLLDTLIDPFNIVMLHNKKPELMYARWGADLVDLRLQYKDTYEKLKETSLDLYSTIRSIYEQKRGDGVKPALDSLDKTPSSYLDEPAYDEELDA